MGLGPGAVIVLALVGGGFLVLIAAAVHRTVSRRSRRAPTQVRAPEQEGYMREVRARGLETLTPAHMKPGMTQSIPYTLPYSHRYSDGSSGVYYEDANSRGYHYEEANSRGFYYEDANSRV